MAKTFKILGFAGSLRKGSYNRALLRTAAQLLPEGIALEIFDLDGIPLYNADLEASMPEKVKLFKSAIRNADAILIATPEYNRSISGVLKNAIDWASRPPQDNPFDGKPVALMSASTGMLGGAGAQYHLRQTFVFLNMHPLNRPEVFVSFANQKFDANGNFTDEKGKQLIRDLIIALVDWTRRLYPQKPD
ncbi:MAG: NAD(P)H-dependent oxidoreductase [Dehalococcoidales bacterium]|jgi:chromate reductase|nr:NAD(P)H-dependent oxidoreductase [Dehalococcoidales bacterium]